ncbi:hypothetical protein EW026_g1839 [Hermanssonia centrifuga]|uniref:Uncharacterized protein n=1 Tax=Hermanssonia centrifuga TaxID=98765 RepID=A0A4S4KR43_9APHY|nr:hypothetical protein EW026_g1839 [Hermanssonia centrifuga]
MPGLTKLPPFPEDVPTHPLLIIDYQLIKQGDSEEIDETLGGRNQAWFW